MDKKQSLIENWGIRLALVLYDVFAVNASFFVALVVRFYINGQFSELAVPYISAFFSFAPYYTICALIVFCLFRMYIMVWRAAGINDLKMIFLANVCTCIIQVVGTVLFVRRMPVTYYVIGTVIQLSLVCLIRFIPRLLFHEGFQEKISKDAIPTMIVGVGTNAMILQDQIRRGVMGKERLVCLLDYESDRGIKRVFNGLPVVYGVDNMAAVIRKYRVGCVYITERSISEEVRAGIKAVCTETGVEMHDFIIGTADDSKNREWMRRYEEENGEEVSFF